MLYLPQVYQKAALRQTMVLSKACLDTKLDRVKKTTVFLLFSVYMAHINTIF